jgi:hypothetical protein
MPVYEPIKHSKITEEVDYREHVLEYSHDEALELFNHVGLHIERFEYTHNGITMEFELSVL